MSLTFGEDEGFLDVTFKTKAGDTTVRLDLYEAQCALLDAAKQHPADEGGDGPAWKAWGVWLTGQGAPPLSVAELYRLSAALNAAIAEYKKKVLDSSSEHASDAPSGCPSSAVPSPT